MPKDQRYTDKISDIARKMKNPKYGINVNVPKELPSYEVMDDILIICKNPNYYYHGKWISELNNKEMEQFRTSLTGKLINRILELRRKKLKVADFVYRNRSGKILNSIVKFGKYKGKFLEEVPFDYLEWLNKNSERGLFGEMAELYKKMNSANPVEFYTPPIFNYYK
jgi:uncharacterized protein (DUF3820 family)